MIVAAIEAYSPEKDKVKAVRAKLMRYAFSMGLQRFGLLAQEQGAPRAEVVLDWPPRHEREPLNVEYRHAHATGKSADGQDYHCGALADIGFSDAPHFSTMQYSCMLQVADLVVGASRDFLRGARLQRFGPGLECLRLVRGRFRGAPDRVASHGLVVSAANQSFRTAAALAIRHELFEVPRPSEAPPPF